MSIAAGVPSTVIKVGGRVQADPQLALMMAVRWLAYRRRLTSQPAELAPPAFCIVHGGGDEVSALQRAAGVEPTFVGGRRVTAADDIDRLRMALSGLANKRLVAALGVAGARAIGLSGEDGALLRASPMGDGSLGAVGEVREVNTALIALLVGAGYLPVVAPVAMPLTGGGVTPPASAFNVNGDDAAAAIAGALGVDELLLISDVPGVRLAGNFVSHLSRAEAEHGITQGEIVGGMEAKVQAALATLDRGVMRVRIGGPAILSDADSGTTISARAGQRSENSKSAVCPTHEVGV